MTVVNDVKRGKQRGRLSTDLERQMFTLLLAESSRGTITDLDLHPAPLSLAYKCTYTPDATCICGGRREYWEAKDYWVKKRDDGGWIKLKVAAQMFQDADFFLYERTKNRGIKIKMIPVLQTLEGV